MTEILTSRLHLIEPFDPILNQVADEVAPAEVGSQPIQRVIDRMLQLAAGKGHAKEDSRQMVGLAAVQLGVGKRIISIDIDADGSNKHQNIMVIVNPVITKRSADTVQGREGCWSCGNICGNVERSREIVLGGLNRHGNPVSLDLADFVARIAQHETDHLDGIRFPERIPVNHPERLHLVHPTEFDSYRHGWQHWPTLCPREQWESMKGGESVG